MGKVLKIVAVGALLFTGAGAVLGGALAGLGSVGSILAAGLEIALVGIGLQAAAGILGLLPSQNTSEQGQQIRMATGPAEPREYVYGKRRTGGSIVYRDTRGTDNEDLWLVSVVASHEIDSFQAFHVDEKTVTLSSAAVQTSPYNGFMDIHTALGTDGQTAISAMTSELTNWGSNHRLRGNAYIGCKLKFNQDVYPGGIPNISVVIRGKKVFDPRVGGHDPDDPATWAYSANPVLCCLDYMRDSLIGPNFPYSAFEEANIIAAANECDEDISVVGGGTINRYESHGVVNSEMAHAEVIQLFEKSMAGTITESGGKFRFHPGEWNASSLALDEDDILSISATPAPSRDNLVNAVKGLFIDPAQAYQPQDYPPKTDSTAETEDGGERFWLDLDLGFTTDHRMAQRIAKIAFERSRRRMTARVKTNLKGLGVKVMDVIDITHANWGWSGKTFRVREWSFDPASAAVNMVLSEEDSTVYDWTSGTDEQTYGAPAVPTFFSPFGAGLPLLGGFGFASLPFTGSNGITVPGLQAFWSTPGSWAQKIQVQYKGALEAATLYKSIPEQALIGPDKNHFPVVPGDYDVRGRYLTTYGPWSPWASQLGTNIPAGVGDATAGANWNTNLTGQPQHLENLIRYPYFDGAAADMFASQDAQHIVVADAIGDYPNRLALTASSANNNSQWLGDFPVEPGDPIYIQFSGLKTVAVNSGAEAGIFLQWLDKDFGSPTSTQIFYDDTEVNAATWTPFSSRAVVPASKYYMRIFATNRANHTAGTMYIAGAKVQRAIDTDQMFNSAVEKSKIEDLAVSEPYSDVQSPSPQTMILTQNTWDAIDGISIDATIPSGEIVDVWVLLSGSVHTEDSTGYAIDVRLLEEGVQKLLFTYAWGSNDMTTQTEGSFDFNVPLLGRFTGSGVEKTYTVEVRLVAPFFTAAGGWQAPLGFRTRDSQLVMRKVAK